MNALGDLLKKALDLVIALWPVVVIDAWERGLRVRLGEPIEVLETGWHWVIPYVDVVWTRETNAEPFNCGKQTIDGQTVEVIGFGRLTDIRQFYIEVNDDVKTTIASIVAAATSQVLSNGSAKGATDAVLRTILRKARTKAEKWGLGIDWIAFYTVTEGSVLRVIADSPANPVTPPVAPEL